MSYFPGVTHVKPLLKIKRERLLPRAGEVAVRAGMEVTPVQVVARTAQETGFQILRASEMLEVPPEDLHKYLLVEEGAALQRGMPLLRKRGLFGRNRRYVSPVDGILYQVGNGSLILQQTPSLLELRAMVSGRVTNVLGNRGVIIETNGSLIQGVWSSGREAYGKINVLTGSGDETFPAENIGAQASGNILVSGRIEQFEAMQQAEENGARGIIVGSMPAALFQAVAALSIPVIITDGIGQQPMAEPIFTLLQQSQGREASLFGQVDNQRNQRPEIIIPLPAEGESPPAIDESAMASEGQRVRILGGRPGQRIGRIVKLHSQPRTTEIGTRVPGADIELPDGVVMFVPYTNLDLIM